MPKVSVVYLSYRPGGIDVLADSLKHQTCQSYELILVDDLISRRDTVVAYMQEEGVNLTRISPSKPKCFPELSYCIANAQNTGVLLSQGDIIIILDDYAWLPPDCLEKFLRYERDMQERDLCISAVAITIDDTRKRYLERPISVWEKPWSGEPFSQGFKIHSLWKPQFFEMFCTAFSWNTLVKMNGFPECYDYDTGTNWIGAAEAVTKIGGKMFVDETNIIYVIENRDWGKQDGKPSLWWAGNIPHTGPKELQKRENTFNLATHKRGTVTPEAKGGNMETKIMAPFPQGGKILEVGGGDQAIFHPNLDMRKINGVDITCDLEEKWPVEDASYDGVFGKFVIEHIGWRKVPLFVSELYRVLKPGGGAMMVTANTLEQCREVVKLGKIGLEENSLLFGGQEERGWNEHKSAWSQEYAVEVFKKAGFDRVETETWPGQIYTGARTDLIIRAWKAGALTSPQPETKAGGMTQQPWYRELEQSMGAAPEVKTLEPRKVALNLGSFTVMVKSNPRTEWINMDILDMSQYPAVCGYKFRQFDARQGIPWPDGSVDIIIAYHFIEHITRAEGTAFLKECYRVLRPGGVLRVGIPDTRVIIQAYSEGKMRDWEANEGVKNAEDECEGFWNLLTAGHLTAYDKDSLAQKMASAGFPANVGIYECGPDDSNSPEILSDTRDMYSGTDMLKLPKNLTMFVEGVKPHEVGVVETNKPLYKKYLDDDTEEGS